MTYDDVTFRFVGGDTDLELTGSVIVGEGEMTLDIPGGDGPYVMVGKQHEHWFEGANSYRERTYETEAQWARIGNSYVGFWDENDYAYLFSFELG